MSIAATDLVRDRYKLGWFLEDDSTVITNDEVADVPFWPVRYDGETPVYAPMRQRLLDKGRPTIVCPRCMEPVWAITRHAVERHGDTDVEVRPPSHPGKTPPDWFQPDWI